MRLLSGALATLLWGSVLVSMSSCEGEGWSWREAALEAGESALGLSVSWSDPPGVEGWLYSYGLAWERCPEPSLAQMLGLWGVAKASHSLELDGEGQWSWHAALDLSDAGDERLEMALEPGEYCGLSWIFSHGGMPVEGVLASMHLSADEEPIALSSHAARVAIAFEEPICVGEVVPEVRLTLDTEAWLRGPLGAQNPALGARDAWLSLGEHLRVSTSPCP